MDDTVAEPKRKLLEAGFAIINIEPFHREKFEMKSGEQKGDDVDLDYHFATNWKNKEFSNLVNQARIVLNLGFQLATIFAPRLEIVEDQIKQYISFDYLLFAKSGR